METGNRLISPATRTPAQERADQAVLDVYNTIQFALNDDNRKIVLEAMRTVYFCGVCDGTISVFKQEK